MADENEALFQKYQQEKEDSELRLGEAVIGLALLAESERMEDAIKAEQEREPMFRRTHAIFICAAAIAAYLVVVEMVR